ncbi:hypothetical protein H4J57_19255 [Colwellia sp. BRX8-7]|uniref:hypothetical protein n=1 Tax=unclassified Colwellia TaxID=196834 RepID=UPI0015F3F57D|nr:MULTISPECIES: hypothetical protein [unclassified Colwellia]MBA6251791.1 hypothetical protein [Colwellia sp. MB3u-55]MBA6339325.1 hypothetical protein [Colwellia sp. BRX8-7]
MNWSRIIKFSAFHFVALTLLSTLTTLLIGADNLDKQEGIDLLLYFKLPSFFVGSIILTLFAKAQESNVLLHLSLTEVISSVVATFIVSLLMQTVYISPTWFIDLPLTVISILVAIFIAGKFRGITRNAT